MRVRATSKDSTYIRLTISPFILVNLAELFRLDVTRRRRPPFQGHIFYCAPSPSSVLPTCFCTGYVLWLKGLAACASPPHASPPPSPPARCVLPHQRRRVCTRWAPHRRRALVPLEAAVRGEIRLASRQFLRRRSRSIPRASSPPCCSRAGP
jgi:hypothetical protein